MSKTKSYIMTTEQARENLKKLRVSSNGGECRKGRFDLSNTHSLSPETYRKIYLHNQEVLYTGLDGFGYGARSRPIVDTWKGGISVSFHTYEGSVELLEYTGGCTTCEFIEMIWKKLVELNHVDPQFEIIF